MKTIYVADDGKQFATESECARYERFVQSNKLGSKLRFFKSNFRELTAQDPRQNFEECSYIYIADHEALRFLDDLTTGDYWCDLPESCGLFYYDDNHEAFFDLSEKISDLKKELSEYEDLALRCNMPLKASY